MQKSIKKLLSFKDGYSLPVILNLISVMLSLRGIVRSKSSFWALVHFVNAGISGYMLVKNTRYLIKERNR